MDPGLTRWLTDVLGHDATVVDRARLTGRRVSTGQDVLEVVDSVGGRWFVKRVAEAAAWRAEVRAYRHWVAALGDCAPTLRAVNRPMRTIMISALPGTRPDDGDAAAAHQAGALLRRLQQAGPRPAPDQAPDPVVLHLKRRLAALPGLLERRHQAFLDDQLAVLDSLPAQPLVPCHGDFLPHNWMQDVSGVIRLIDFGNSHWAPAARDLVKLHFRPWWRRPHLPEVFYEGYGRHPTEVEKTYVQAHLAVRATLWIAFGRTAPPSGTSNAARSAWTS